MVVLVVGYIIIACIVAAMFGNIAYKSEHPSEDIPMILLLSALWPAALSLRMSVLIVSFWQGNR